MKDTIIKWLGVVGLVLAVVALVTAPHGLVSNGSKPLGATAAGGMLAENYIPYVLYNGGYNSAKDLNITGGTTIGASGTTFTNLIGTTCNLIGTDASQAATTTVAYDCAITGLTSSFSVVAQLATSTLRLNGAGGQYWTIVGAKASTTAGFATVLLNNTGPAQIPSLTSVGSSTVIWAFK